MKVNIKDQELELHYSLRIYIIYENMTDKTIEPEDFYKMTNVITLLYATIVASLQYYRQPASLDWNDYMDWIDNQGGEKILLEFSQWFVKESEAQKSMEPILTDGNLKKKKKDHQSKKS